MKSYLPLFSRQFINLIEINKSRLRSRLYDTIGFVERCNHALSKHLTTSIHFTEINFFWLVLMRKFIPLSNVSLLTGTKHRIFFGSVIVCRYRFVCCVQRVFFCLDKIYIQTSEFVVNTSCGESLKTCLHQEIRRIHTFLVKFNCSLRTNSLLF